MKYAAKILIVSVTLLTNGCGAIMNGQTKTIEIQGTSGAIITGDGLGVITVPVTIGKERNKTGDNSVIFTIPTIIELERRNNYILTFSKPGYKDATIEIKKKIMIDILIADILLTGLIGVVIDAASGSWNKLVPDHVTVHLEKKDIGVIGPEKIGITLSTVGKSGQIEINSDISVDMFLSQSN